MGKQVKSRVQRREQFIQRAAEMFEKCQIAANTPPDESGGWHTLRETGQGRLPAGNAL